ncbi:MAG: hypothetical protein QM742_09710 [Aquabacterium sp.]
MSIGSAGGSLIYALDDPYIHLAVARAIKAGWYGVNLGEWSSPSSSILWPLLMAPWPSAQLEIAPLLFNTVCCLLNVWVLREVLRGPLFTPRQQWMVAVLAAFGLNLFGLVMTGMEHTLQTLLSTFVAWRLVTRRFDAPFYVALAVMPWVRYECLALSGVAALYVWFTAGQRIKPVLALLASAAGIAAFSLFLHDKGLPLLPSSILAKNAERSTLMNLALNPGFYLILWWLHHGYKRERTVFWLLCVLPLAAFMLLGRSGWFGRYEAFMAAWLMVFALHAAQREPLPEARRWWAPTHPRRFFAGLTLCLPSLWACTLMTPYAAANIARQQGLMAEVAHELARPVAVNDLGLVSMRSNQYVLDLWGLGSPEALALRLSGRRAEDWMSELTQHKHVQYAFLFERWFPRQPAGWIKVAELKLDVPRVVVPSDTVSLFATDAQAAAPLRQALLRLAQDPDKRARIRLQPAAAAQLAVGHQPI